jgi:hypothetical protein
MVDPSLGQTYLDRLQKALWELAGQDLWWWVWAAPKLAERGAPTPAPEYEPLCPADDIEQAARRITTVLGVREDDTTGEPSDA